MPGPSSEQCKGNLKGRGTGVATLSPVLMSMRERETKAEILTLARGAESSLPSLLLSSRAEDDPKSSLGLSQQLWLSL